MKGTEVLYKGEVYVISDTNDFGEVELEDNSDPYNRKYLWVYEDEVEEF